MKKLMLVMLSLGILLSACDMNNQMLPEPELEGNTKSVELKMVPFKGEVQSNVTEYQNGAPIIGTLSGHMTQLGKLITAKSIWYTTALEFENPETISWEMIGSVCAANGDLVHYNLSATFIVTENRLSAHASFDGGTGRFEHAKGYLEITGYADDPVAITTMFMDAEGMISSVGSSK